MSKYILLECNRLNGKKSFNNIDESQDTYKNKWINNVSNYGLIVEPGDQIVCESVAINTIGASDDTVEILGEKNQNGFLDNKIGINYSFYVCDTGNHLIKLPLKNHQTYTSQDQTARYTTGINLKNRALGEPNLQFFSTTPADIGTIPTQEDMMPSNNLVNYYNLSQLSADIGNGFTANGIYSVAEAGYTDYTFKVLEITAEGGKTGIPTKIQLWNLGATRITAGTKLTIMTNFSSVPIAKKKQGIQVFNSVADGFASKWNVGPTGQRFYFPQMNYTGPCFINYPGLLPDASTNITTDFNPKYTKRSAEVVHEIPVGLNTPDNISTILTDQLHRPTRLYSSAKTDFIDYSTVTMLSINNKNEGTRTKMPLITTPIYQPMPTMNGRLLGRTATDNYNSFAGIRKYYYNNIGFANPERLEGLSWSRQLKYGLNNNDGRNQINTGANQAIAGDFNFGANANNQQIGDLGLNMCIIQSFPNTTGHKSVIEYPEGGWILTNAYFTEENIKTIAEGFRKCEKFGGNLNDPFEIDSDNYKNNLIANLDIGLYVDEFSSPTLTECVQTLSVPGGGYADRDAVGSLLNRLSPNQRRRFFTYTEYVAGGNTGRIHREVDIGYRFDSSGPPATTDRSNNNYCVGTQPYGFINNYNNSLKNDGQQLSSLMVNSRWQENFAFDATDPGYLALYNQLRVMPGQNPAFIGCGNNTIQETFISTYTDANDNILRTYQDLVALSRKYNVACIPVFPPNPAGIHTSEYNKFATQNDVGRPYIAFRSYTTLGVGDYDILQGGKQIYQIDTRNIPYGIQLGYDASFIRNKAAILMNTDWADFKELNQNEAYAPLIYMGASNPSFDFDPSLSRFSFSGLNTPMTIGNGLPTQDQLDLSATANPEQQVYNVSSPGQIGNIQTKNDSQFSTITTIPVPASPHEERIYTPAEISILNEDVPQTPTTFIDSYAGASIESIILFQDDTARIVLSNNGFYSSNYVDDPLKYFHEYNTEVLTGSLFGKMGWDVRQLLPVFGDPQGTFNNPLSFEKEQKTYIQKFLNTPRPQTTGAYISSAEYQPTETNSQDMPYYGIGINIGLQANPAVNQGPITAQNLPSKLDYPYLNLYSSIVAQGTDTEYYGSADGKSRIPCLAYITRNNNQGDFFYGLEQSFSYTATKAFTLTEIETDIRLPNGTRPRLQPHNSVIYKITKARELPNNNILINNTKK